MSNRECSFNRWPFSGGLTVSVLGCQHSLFGQSSGQACHSSEPKNQNQLRETGASKQAEMAPGAHVFGSR